MWWACAASSDPLPIHLFSDKVVCRFSAHRFFTFFDEGAVFLNRQLSGHLMALFVSVVWGTTFISSKLLLSRFHPVEIVVLRFLAAWIILFCISPKPLLPKSLKTELPFVLAGLTGLTIYYLFENTALTFTLASNCGIVMSTAPMFTALALWISRRSSRPRLTFFAGFALAMTGISIISLAGSRLDLNPIGNLFLIGAALAWGCYGIFLEMASTQGYTTLQTTRKIFFWGLLFTAACIPLYGGQLTFDLTRLLDPVMGFNILYLSAGASALCFILWNTAIDTIGTLATNLYIYLTPVITLVASALILGEPITVTSVCATGLIVTGLWLSQRSGKSN